MSQKDKRKQSCRKEDGRRAKLGEPAKRTIAKPTEYYSPHPIKRPSKPKDE